jgi:CheY-like chemotaxis protein
MLEHLGCVVEIAANGLIATDLAKKTRFDAIFMDIHMPGILFCKLVQQRIFRMI